MGSVQHVQHRPCDVPPFHQHDRVWLPGERLPQQGARGGRGPERARAAAGIHAQADQGQRRRALHLAHATRRAVVAHRGGHSRLQTHGHGTWRAGKGRGGAGAGGVVHASVQQSSATCINRACGPLLISPPRISLPWHACAPTGRVQTNIFHQNTVSDLAIRYNDVSILENFHVAEAFELMLRHKECDILAPLSREQRRECRETIIQMVLATGQSTNHTSDGLNSSERGHCPSICCSICFCSCCVFVFVIGVVMCV